MAANQQVRPFADPLLATEGSSGKIVAGLAESWEMTKADGTEWVFKLKKGVQFHDGWGEFTAADVAHTWGLHVREEALGNFKALWESGEPTIIDDHTIEFNFDPPMVDGTRLFSRLAGDLVIQSKAQWDAGGGTQPREGGVAQATQP